MKLLNASPRFALISVLLLSFFLGGCAVAPPSPSQASVSQLAPTGKIRLAMAGNNPNYLNQPAQPPYSGVAVDIGNALSKRVGAPLEIVQYQSQTELLVDATMGKWDAAIPGIEDSRRSIMEFSPPYAVTQNSYLVPAGSTLMTIADVDKGGRARG